jgi:hypothetical protein
VSIVNLIQNVFVFSRVKWIYFLYDFTTIITMEQLELQLAQTLKLSDDSDSAKFLEFISKIEDAKIILIRQKEVIQWIFGDLSFLPKIEKKNKTKDEVEYKKLEDNWGQTMLKIRRPDLKLDKQWTNKFGEHICEEIYNLLGKNVSKPTKKEHYQPDIETEDAIIEVKTGTFYTSGTAGEKILGCPFKYAEIPELYTKPLKIICLGGAEKICKETYGNLPGPKCSLQKKKFLDFFRENKIEYVGASDILRMLSS